MQANVGRETSPEQVLRRALRRARARFECDARPEPSLRCKADFVLRGRRVCVFVDGCWWHRCPTHFRPPKANARWWKEKISANVDRDRRQTAALVERRWRVVRLWEHEIGTTTPERVVSMILAKQERP
jgi:DNA mismatch endonuclease (patch repair protein)